MYMSSIFVLEKREKHFKFQISVTSFTVDALQRRTLLSMLSGKNIVCFSNFKCIHEFLTNNFSVFVDLHREKSITVQNINTILKLRNLIFVIH